MEVEEVQTRMRSVTPLSTTHLGFRITGASDLHYYLYRILGEKNARDVTHTYRSCLQACTSHFQQDKLTVIVEQRLTNHAKENLQQNNNKCRRLIFEAKLPVDTIPVFLAILSCADAESRL